MDNVTARQLLDNLGMTVEELMEQVKNELFWWLICASIQEDSIQAVKKNSSPWK